MSTKSGDVGINRRLLRLKQIVPNKLPVARSTFWLWVKQGKLPQPVRLGARCSAWWEDEVDAAIDEMAGMRRQTYDVPS